MLARYSRDIHDREYQTPLCQTKPRHGGEKVHKASIAQSEGPFRTHRLRVAANGLAIHIRRFVLAAVLAREVQVQEVHHVKVRNRACKKEQQQGTSMSISRRIHKSKHGHGSTETWPGENLWHRNRPEELQACLPFQDTRCQFSEHLFKWQARYGLIAHRWGPLWTSSRPGS